MDGYTNGSIGITRSKSPPSGVIQPIRRVASDQFAHRATRPSQIELRDAPRAHKHAGRPKAPSVCSAARSFRLRVAAVPPCSSRSTVTRRLRPAP